MAVCTCYVPWTCQVGAPHPALQHVRAGLLLDGLHVGAQQFSIAAVFGSPDRGDVDLQMLDVSISVAKGKDSRP